MSDTIPPVVHAPVRVTVPGGVPSDVVVTAIADATERDPLAFGPLYEVVELDALDDLLASNPDAVVSFEVDGLAVRVDGAVTVSVEAAAT